MSTPSPEHQSPQTQGSTGSAQPYGYSPAPSQQYGQYGQYNQQATGYEAGYPQPGYGYGTAQTCVPRPVVGFAEAVRKNFKYMFHFSGRASRTEFWYAYLAWTLITVLISAIAFGIFFVTLATQPMESSNGAPPDAFIIALLVMYGLIIAVSIAMLVATLGLGWRRLHDAGFPGALWLLTLVGLGIVPIIMCIMPSSPEGCRYDGSKDLDRP